MDKVLVVQVCGSKFRSPGPPQNQIRQCTSVPPALLQRDESWSQKNPWKPRASQLGVLSKQHQCLQQAEGEDVRAL